MKYGHCWTFAAVATTGKLYGNVLETYICEDMAILVIQNSMHFKGHMSFYCIDKHKI